MTKALRRLVEFAAGRLRARRRDPRDIAIDGPTEPPSVFLDSGTLISLFYFWDACKQAQTEPGAITGPKGLMQALKAAGLDESLLKLTGDISRGVRAFRALTGSSNSRVCFSSRVCWAEMHHTFLQAKCLEELVRRGVPRSFREQRPQLLCQAVLVEADYDALRDDVAAFRASMAASGIDVVDAEDLALNLGIDSAAIWEMAQEVWSLVLMDVPDAYVVAAAIAVQADEFRSANEAVRNALELLRDLGTGQDDAAESMRQRLGLTPEMTVPRPVPPGASPT